jgi:hypothetical protein
MGKFEDKVQERMTNLDMGFITSSEFIDQMRELLGYDQIETCNHSGSLGMD